MIISLILANAIFYCVKHELSVSFSILSIFGFIAAFYLSKGFFSLSRKKKASTIAAMKKVKN